MYKSLRGAMDNCKHVPKISPSRDHSILNPQKWLCVECGTTESVWACLSCSYVACGRYILEHAFDHYKQTKHPLAIEVNDKYVFCYECDEYVLNDNAAGDIKILRSALSAVATQSFNDVEGRGRRLLRSHSFSGFSTRLEAERHMRNEDLSFTAVKFRRYYTLAKAFGSWKQHVLRKRPPPKHTQVVSPTKTSAEKPRIGVSPSLRKRAFIPGVTGLRNLGNTCYMNSILQVLSHLDDFREFFLALRDAAYDVTPASTPSCASLASPVTSAHSLLAAAAAHGSRVMGPGHHHHPKVKVTADSRPVSSYTRQSTIECFQHINSGKKPRLEPSQTGTSRRQGGLNGGSSTNVLLQRINTVTLKDKNTNLSLSEELHALFRVLWSGRWAIVSPHKMLDAVWSIIPFFRGYTQQDAQEFLCELLDKVQTELGVQYPGIVQLPEAHFSTANFISHLFQGQLVSQVKCLKCKKSSETHEPFMDLSLEFPDVYHTIPVSKQTVKQCALQEMLAKFTETEDLGQIYSCEKCNRRRKSAGSTLLTEAQKRFMIDKLPRVLRLHLKRFKWCGRNNRGKISTHVQFGAELDMAQYSSVRACRESTGGTVYKLAAVVMHHGRGFGSGHYTAYCLNKEAGKRKDSWIHCNDARMERCALSDVMSAQAYILFYIQTSGSLSHTTTQENLCASNSHTSVRTASNMRTPSNISATTVQSGQSSNYASASSQLSQSPSVASPSQTASVTHRTHPRDQPGGATSSASGRRKYLSEAEVTSSVTTEIADDEITFNFRNSSVLPRFDRLHGGRKRKSGTGSNKPELKRRKTVVW